MFLSLLVTIFDLFYSSFYRLFVALFSSAFKMSFRLFGKSIAGQGATWLKNTIQMGYVVKTVPVRLWFRHQNFSFELS